MKRGILVSALALASWTLAGCGSKDSKVDAAGPAAKPSPVPAGEITIPVDSPKLKQLTVEAVTTADVPTNVVVAPGKIELNPNRVAHVVLPLGGKIVGVMVKLGDSVEQGQPLLTLESSDSDAAVSGFLQSEAAISLAKSGLLKAQKDYDRVKDLLANKAIAEKEFVNAESAVRQAQAAVDTAEASSRQAKRRLELLGLNSKEFGQRLTVRAPVAGKILELTVAPGEYRNDTNASLMTIADMSTVWVASDVPEADIRFIEVGERLDIELSAYPNEAFHGRVMRIADTVDPQTRAIKVRAEMANPGGRFRPEMFARIRHVESTERHLVIPSVAVFQGDGGNVVYREKAPGVFQATPVTLGNKAAGDKVAVIKGLSPGDKVVTDGVMLLKAG